MVGMQEHAMTRTPSSAERQRCRELALQRDATQLGTEIIEDTALYREMMTTVRRDYPIRPSGGQAAARGPHLRTSVTRMVDGPGGQRLRRQMAHQLQSRGAPPRSSVHTIGHPPPPPPFPSSASPPPSICITAIAPAQSLKGLGRTSQPPTHGRRKRTGQP